MKVPGIRSKWRRGGFATALVCAFTLLPVAFAGGPKNAAGPLVIHGEDVGFFPTAAPLGSTSGTMFTLHFVDETHLLLTFNARSLLKRMPDAKPEDEDRNVAAELIELPSGRVLAKTEWRTRDRNRYLWPLGHGAFLVRVRERLSVIAPMANLKRGEPFHEEQILDVKRRIGYLTVSPTGDLLGVETVPPRAAKIENAAVRLDEPAAGEVRIGDGRPQVQINFYRLVREGDGSRVVAARAGVIGSDSLIELPADADGFLDVKKDPATPGYWLFDYVSHAGKRTELAAYETTCAPRATWISRSEFVAFGCRGSNEQQELSYFNLKGEEPWVNVLHGAPISPMIVASAESGRLAMGRTLLTGPIYNDSEVTPDMLQAQDITVLQGYDGRTLLHVQATPIQRMGQNFDLSADGTKFAVVRGGNVEVYTLPARTAKDDAAVKAAEAMAPERNEAEIRLNAVKVEETPAEEKVEAKAEVKEVISASAVPVTTGAAAAAGGTLRQPEVHYVVDGDPQVTEPGEKPRRKAPTLYGDSAGDAAQADSGKPE